MDKRTSGGVDGDGFNPKSPTPTHSYVDLIAGRRAYSTTIQKAHRVYCGNGDTIIRPRTLYLYSSQGWELALYFNYSDRSRPPLRLQSECR